MRNTKRIFLCVGMLVALLLLTFVLASCGECKHEWSGWTGVGDATCKGQTEVRGCSLCGATEEQFNKKVAGDVHNWGKWETDGKATCQGTPEIRECIDCGEEEEQLNKNALGEHKFGEWASTNITYCHGEEYIRTCSKCSQSEYEYRGGTSDHAWGGWSTISEATCSALAQRQRSCTTCGWQETEDFGELGTHAWGSWNVTKVANCQQAGQRTRSCSACNQSETQVVDKTGHTGFSSCSVCGTALISNPPTFNFDFTNVSSVGIFVSNFELVIDSYTSSPQYNGTTTLEIGEGYLSLDENDQLSGYGICILNSKGASTPVDRDLECRFYIENNNVYIQHFGGVSVSNTSSVPATAVKLSLDSFSELVAIEDTLVDYEDQLAEIEAWTNEYLIPILKNINLGANGSTNLGEQLFSKLISVTTNSDGSYTLSINFDFYKELNTALSEKPISEIIDIVLGNGTFASIEQMIDNETIYEYSVSDLLNYIEVDVGLDLEATLDATDELLAIYTGDSSMTLEKFLNDEADADLPSDFDFYDYITNGEYSDMTVMDALKLAIDSQEATEDMIKEKISEMFGMISTYTVYDLAFGPADDSTDYPTTDYPDGPTATEKEDYRTTLINRIDAMVDLLKDMYSYSLTFNADGSFKSANIALDYSISDEHDQFEFSASLVIDSNLNVTGTATSNLFNTSFQIIPGETTSIDTTWANQIVDELDGIYALSSSEIISILEDYYVYDYDSSAYIKSSDRKNYVTYNASEDCYYLVEYGDCYYDDYNGCYEVEFEVTKIFATLVGVSSVECCNTTLYQNAFVSQVDYYVYYNLYSTFDTTAEMLSLIDYSVVIDNAYFDDLEFTSVDFTYSSGVAESVRPDATYRYLHNYVADYENSTTGESCGDVYYTRYTCTNCGDSYDSYGSISHNYNGTYKPVNPALGIDGGFYKTHACTYCGVASDDYYYEEPHYVTVDSAIGGTVYPHSNYAAFSVTIDESTAGYYVFYSTDEYGEYSSNTDPRGYIYVLLSDGSLTQLTHSDDYNSYQFYCGYNLEAGKTYVFASYSYDNYMVYLEKFDICAVDGHDYEYAYVLVDEEAGIEGGMQYAECCTICDYVNTVDHSLSIDSELGGEYYDYINGYSTFSVTIDESTAGYYVFYSTDEYGEYSSNTDPRACIFEVLSDGLLTELVASDDYNSYQFYCGYNLEAGKTYVFASYSYDNYKVYLEKVDNICEINGHDYETAYTLVDEEAGINGDVQYVEYCQTCGDVSSVYHSVYIDSSIGGEYYDYSDNYTDYVAFSVTIDESTAGYYAFYSTDENGEYTTISDPYGYIYELSSDGSLTELAYDHDTNSWQFYCSAELEAGKTYVFACSNNDTSDTYYVYVNPIV